jgi:nicotinamide-nucleotide adenylyltransferase
MPTPVFPGRFQPFHNGHLMVIQGMVKAVGNPIVVICDPLKPDVAGEDVFTLEERREMISSALLSADIMDATIVTCKDAGSDADWVKYVLDAAEKRNDVVMWSGKEDVRAAFEAAGIATKKIVPVPGIDAAVLREQMRTGNGEWRKKVPVGALDVVEEALMKKGLK